MATMKQVADLAGVSRYTVSKVFNDIPVSEKTLKKVLDACEKLHYRRNIYATNLVKNTSTTIGMIISQNYDSFFGEIINAAEKEAYANGYQLICQCSHGSVEEEADIIAGFESLKVCGIIVAPVVDNFQIEHWESLEARLPVINFDCYLKKDSHYVMNNNKLSAKLITEHLLETGRVPAYLGSVHSHSNLAIKNRQSGYTQTLKKQGFSPLLIPTNNSDETTDSQKFGYDNLTHYLDLGNKLPEALFCATDRIAMGAIHAIQQRGFTIGKDTIVAGHDDLEFGAYMNPTLTTVAQPKLQMGVECVKILLELVNNKPQEKIQKTLQPKLIIRESTSIL